MRRKTQPDPETIRFSQTTAKIVPGFTICNLSEEDIKDLNAGIVPSWLIRTTDFYLRPDPKPSDVAPDDGQLEVRHG